MKDLATPLQIKGLTTDEHKEFKLNCIDSGINMSEAIRNYIKAVNKGTADIYEGES